MINEVECGATHHYDRFVLLQTISADAAAVKARSLRDRAVKGCPLLWLPLLWYRATLDLTDSSAQQAKTTQKNEPVQSCPIPVELLTFPRLGQEVLLTSQSCTLVESKRAGYAASHRDAPFSGTGQLSISLTHPHNKRKPHRKMSRSRVALYQWSYQWSWSGPPLHSKPTGRDSS